MSSIATFLFTIAGSLALRVLTALGIGIFSYTALTALADSVITSAQTAFSGISGDIAAIINLAGAGQMFGILAGAYITRASLMAIKQMRPT